MTREPIEVTRQDRIYCLKVSSDYHSEVCEECKFYPNCDHMTQDDLTELTIRDLEALEQQPEIDVSNVPHKIAEFFSNWDGDENAKMEISVNDMREIAFIYGKKARIERQLKEKNLEQQPFEDCISRKDILNHQYTIDENETLGMSTRNVVNVDDILNAKSVQPKYNADEWCKDCKEYDHDKHCCPRYNKVIRNTVEEMKQCEDAISRQAVLDALEQEEPLVWCDGADEIAAHDQWESDVDTIKNMPSVQPKQKVGHWIYERWDMYSCSVCHHWHTDLDEKMNYCPNCGARMIEPRKSEDKE